MFILMHRFFSVFSVSFKSFVDASFKPYFEGLSMVGFINSMLYFSLTKIVSKPP